MRSNVFEIESNFLGELNPEQSTIAFRDLLWAETHRIQVSSTKIHITENITVPDGGIDATIDCLSVKTDSFLLAGNSYFQIKSGNISPWQKSWVKNELFGRKSESKKNLGAEVLHCLNSDGRYVLACFRISLSSDQVHKIKNHFNLYFEECGYKGIEIEIWGQTHLARLFNRYPGLCLKIKGIDGSFISHNVWSRDSLMNTPLHIGDEQKEFITTMRTQIESDEIKHIRVLGEPGLGKTRLVMESLSTKEFNAITVYFKHANDFQNSNLMNELLRPDGNICAIIVVDECSKKEMVSIWASLTDILGASKLITIDHGPEQKLNEKSLVRLDCPKLEEKQIIEILGDYIDNKSDLNRWAEYCGGSPRVAHALGTNLKNNPKDILASPSEVPIWDRFIAGYGELNEQQTLQILCVLRHIALFRKFGFRQPVDCEGKWISELTKETDSSITYPKFCEIVNMLKERRILQGKKTLFIVPKALHIYLWLDFWKNYGEAHNLISLLQRILESMTEWFTSMFRYGYGNDKVQEHIKQILGVQGVYDEDGFAESRKGCRLLNVLAEANPKATLECIQRKYRQWSYDKLLAFHEGRQDIVWALEKISIWSDTFYGALHVLAKLAEAENANNGNNATGIFVSLFSLGYGRLAPTTVHPKERIQPLNEILKSDNIRLNKLGLKALKSALSTYNGTRIVGAEYQGIRPVPEFWMPKTYGELWEEYKRYWDLLIEIRNGWDSDLRREANEIIVGCSAGLFQIPILVETVLDELEKLVDDKGPPLQKIVELVTRTIRFREDKYEKKIISKLKDINNKITGNTYQTRLRRYVLLASWNDLDDDEGGTTQRKKLTCLAKESYLDINDFEKFVEEIVKGKNLQINQFGQILADEDNERQLLPIIIKTYKRLPNESEHLLLSGYLASVFLQDEKEWEQYALEILSDEEFGNIRFNIIRLSGLTDNIFIALLENLREGNLEINELLTGYWAFLKKINKKSILKMLNFLYEAGTWDSLAAAVGILDEYFIRGKIALPESLTLEILTGECLFEDKYGHGHISWYWNQIAKEWITQYQSRKTELFEKIFLTCPENLLTLCSVGDDAKNILWQIAKEDPNNCWQVLTKIIEDVHSRIYSRIRHWLGNEISFDDNVFGAIILFEIGSITDWIDGNPKERAPYIARTVPKSFDNNYGKITRTIVDKYGDLQEVRNALHCNFGSGGWCGPRSKHCEEKRRNARQWLLNEQSQNVRNWLQEYIKYLTMDIEQAELEEEREF